MSRVFSLHSNDHIRGPFVKRQAERAMALPTLIQNHSGRNYGVLGNVQVPSPQPTSVSVSFASISSETF